MPAIANPRVIFASVPKGCPVPGEDVVYDETEQIDIENVSLEDGQAIVKLLVLSCDPYMRGRMRDASIKSYTPAFELGKPLTNFGVAEVVRSNNSAYNPGQKLYGFFQFQSYNIITASPGSPPAYKTIGDEDIPVTAWVGAAGMPGKTAVYGMKAYSKAKKGEKIFVTSAYGPVGQLVCQIAKREGLDVLASAGSDKKVEWLRKELGVTAFNYKTESTVEQLQKFGPIDIYWDAVGGEVFDAALGAMNKGGRAIECGMISGYNSSSTYVFKNIMRIVSQELSVNGFIVSSHEAAYVKEFYENVPKTLATGEIKFEEDVYKGLKTVPQAIVDMLKGDNDGKVVISLADN
ncbi:Predicted NAD-dependent oxidoreductase [Phaffia rhodozyma]|uniref:Predicted NAD-dependent oxidoreductase n=1 Tax=Phaffia rhodozyma TaxID=264483 RepID=A0A0F7SL07_PHARH|nr:Predicted NAD-dependent oxidoreductase [Phaffia rhodozyma]